MKPELHGLHVAMEDEGELLSTPVPQMEDSDVDLEDEQYHLGEVDLCTPRKIPAVPKCTSLTKVSPQKQMIHLEALSRYRHCKVGPLPEARYKQQEVSGRHKRPRRVHHRPDPPTLLLEDKETTAPANVLSTLAQHGHSSNRERKSSQKTQTNPPDSQAADRSQLFYRRHLFGFSSQPFNLQHLQKRTQTFSLNHLK